MTDSSAAIRRQTNGLREADCRIEDFAALMLRALAEHWPEAIFATALEQQPARRLS